MQSKGKSLHFYFDFISPYAYFAWRQIPGFCEEYDLQLDIHPIVFGKLLDQWGHLGPAEIPPKRIWLAKYCMRYAEQNGFTYNPPKFHPYNPLPSLRMALKEVSGENQQRVVSTIFNAGWTQGEDLGDVDRLLELLQAEGVPCDEYVDRIADPSIKDRLRVETDNATAQGVFGVPTIIIDDQLFWGNDQFDHIRLYVEGKDPINEEKVAALGSRERAIDRESFIKKS